MNATKFWMVYRPGGFAPTKQHSTRMAAEREAERLARENRADAFYVLEAVCGKVATDITTVDMTEETCPF